MAAEPPEPNNDVDDTIIGIGQASSLPPRDAFRSPIDSTSANSSHADAKTILVSRARGGQVDSVLAEYAHAKSAPQPPEAVHRVGFVIVIGAHAPVLLDAPVYIGRRPRTPRIDGSHVPRLVTVPSPQREVSGTHVEILQQGDTVVVTDLGSTNGTTVTMNGFRPRSLRQGESLAVGAPAVVDIGDGIRIVIKAFSDDTTREGSP